MRRTVAIGLLFPLCAMHAAGQCTNYTVVVSGTGISPGQISWQLVNATAVVVASGGAPANQAVCLPAGCYTMRMFDSGNNGWGQAPFWIRIQPTNTVVAYGTLLNGSFGTQAIDLGGGCGGGPCSPYTLTITSGGAPAQVGWNLVDGFNVIQAGSAPATVALCLDTGCYSMQLFDSGGDGWNGASWTLANGAGNTVQSGTLTSGALGHAPIALGVAPQDCPGVGPMLASDCSSAVQICGNHHFLTTPYGFGAQNEAPFNTVGNPFLEYADGILSNWGTDHDGCLQGGEIHTTWMIINVVGSGTLEFTFGGGGTQAGYYDWILYPHNGTGCGPILAGTVAPVRCNWNVFAHGGTGLSSAPPPGVLSNYEPPLDVVASERYLIGFSNHTAITANVSLVFGGTADIGCVLMLPVELVRFTAEAEGWSVRTRWTTASEQNTLRFDVERSRDAASWTSIGELPAAGNSMQALDYELVDDEPLFDLAYYRLRIVDQDGSQGLSPVATVLLGHDGPLLYPNPSDGTFWVQADGKVEVFDAMGRASRFEMTRAGAGPRQLFIPSPGVYTVRVGEGAVIRTERLVVR